MFKPDSDRIAWFLDPQHVLRFPRYSLAPVTSSRIFRKPPPYDPGSETWRIPSTRSAAAISARSRSVSRTVYPRLSGANLPKADAGSVANFRLATKAALTPPAISSHIQTLTGLSTGPSRYQSNIKYTESVRAPKGRPPTQRDLYRPLKTTLDKLPQSPKLMSIAPTEIRSPTSEAPTTEYSEMHNSPDVDNPAASRDYGRILKDKHDLPGSDRPAQDQWTSVDKIGTESGDASQTDKSAVSTIHIDGSVLGRWAIQYLERALGKPVAGMTAVDPRATIPRSRIAPF